MSGKVVQTAVLNANKAVINTKNIHAGAYMIKVSTPEGVVTKKIIK